MMHTLSYMKKWWENAKEAFLDGIEAFLDEFWYQWKTNVSFSKIAMMVVVLIVVVSVIVSNHLGSQPSPQVKVKPSSQTASAPPEPPTDQMALEDKAEAMEVAHDFIQNYSTYKPMEPLAEKIKPYVTETFYLNQQEADQHARPTFEVYESKVLSIDKGFIEPMDDNLYWTGNVELETTNAAGKKQKEKSLYAVTLIRDGQDGWKVNEVEILESPNQ